MQLCISMAFFAKEPKNHIPAPMIFSSELLLQLAMATASHASSLPISKPRAAVSTQPPFTARIPQPSKVFCSSVQNFPTHRASLGSTQRFPRKVNYEVWGYGDRSCGGERVCARGKYRTQTRASGGAQCEEAAAAAVEEVKVKIKVGQVGRLSDRVYSFQKIFGPSSSLIVVTLPKPLGIVFVESPWKDANGKHGVLVGELIVGGNAERAARVSQLFVGAPKSNINLNMPVLNGSVMPGDILRATTTAGVVVDFFGIRRPKRVMDLYVADGRPWHLTMRALNASFVADGDLTLVFERRKFREKMKT